MWERLCNRMSVKHRYGPGGWWTSPDRHEAAFTVKSAEAQRASTGRQASVKTMNYGCEQLLHSFKKKKPKKQIATTSMKNLTAMCLRTVGTFQWENICETRGFYKTLKIRWSDSKKLLCTEQSSTDSRARVGPVFLSHDAARSVSDSC